MSSKISKARLEEFGEFIRRRRETLSPADVGLTDDRGRSHTKGLRREEVAMLAKFGPSTLMKLEQGNYDHDISLTIINNLCEALRFEKDSRAHIFKLLSVEFPSLSSLPKPYESVTSAHQIILDNLQPIPAYIMGKRWDILAWNPASIAVFGNFDLLPEQQRNIVWYMFLGGIEQIIVNWERHAERVVYQFRAVYGRATEEEKPWFSELVEEINSKHDQFHKWWEQYNVRGRPEEPKQVKHIKGLLTFTQITMQIEEPEFILVAYVPDPITDTMSKLYQILK